MLDSKRTSVTTHLSRLSRCTHDDHHHHHDCHADCSGHVTPECAYDHGYEDERYQGEHGRDRACHYSISGNLLELSKTLTKYASGNWIDFGFLGRYM
jgi:hypothetical protein